MLGKVERPLPEVAAVIGDRARFIPDEQSVLIGAKAQALSNRISQLRCSGLTSHELAAGFDEAIGAAC